MFETNFTVNDLLFMLKGAGVTLQLTVLAVLIGTLGGVLMGLLRFVLPRASIPLAWLLDVFRSVPLLIQFVLCNAFKSILGLDVSAFTVAVVVLGIYTAAYCCEVVLAGLQAVPPTLYRAGRSLGMSAAQAMRHVVAPMAVRVAFPSWLNVVLGVMKDTSLVLWIGVVELLRASQTIVTRLQEPLLVLFIAGLIYYVMSLVVAQAGNRLERKWESHD